MLEGFEGMTESKMPKMPMKAKKGRRYGRELHGRL
jgi:hypothetical protein